MFYSHKNKTTMNATHYRSQSSAKDSRSMNRPFQCQYLPLNSFASSKRKLGAKDLQFTLSSQQPWNTQVSHSFRLLEVTYFQTENTDNFMKACVKKISPHPLSLCLGKIFKAIRHNLCKMCQPSSMPVKLTTNTTGQLKLSKDALKYTWKN